MKSLIQSTVLLLLVLAHCQGETFLVSDGQTSSITVKTNEAIIIDYLDTNNPYLIYQNGTNLFAADIWPHSAFAGPCELIFSNYSAVVTFHRIQTTAMSTVLLGSNQTNTIVVPANQTLKLFGTRGSGGKFVVTQGASSRLVDYGDQSSGFELTGPLTVSLVGNSGVSMGHELRQLFSYYFTDEFVEVTAEGYLRGPTGTFEVLVEKSTDLAQWIPVMVQSTATSDSKAFYRLRIQK